MTEHQRDTYEQVIAKEWMSENAFIMAWNDFVYYMSLIMKGGGVQKEAYFIEWLFE